MSEENPIGKDLNDLLQVIKIQILFNAGYTLPNILEITESEFTYNKESNLVTELEIWSDKERTVGYKSIKPKKKMQKLLGLKVQNFFNKYPSLNS